LVLIQLVSTARIPNTMRKLIDFDPRPNVYNGGTKK
jgi:hypothetical protein